MKHFSGSAVSRYQVFTLADGTFVVQWDDARVQELLTGQYREFDYRTDFGHAITDYELAQLRASGRVEHFSRNNVWLYPLPEAGRFGRRRVLGRGDRVRAYYLISKYSQSRLDEVREILDRLNLKEDYSARAREDQVVILGRGGIPFRDLKDAENAQQIITDRLRDDLGDLTIAFIETPSTASVYHRSSIDSDVSKLNLDDIIASQTNTSRIAGKRVVLVIKEADEREAFSDLMNEMELDVKYANSAVEAIQLLEDFPSDLLVTDIQLPDMHAFQMISKFNEIENLRELPIILIADQPNIGATVARVDYLIRPVSIARLRHNVWVSLTNSHNSQSSSEN